MVSFAKVSKYNEYQSRKISLSPPPAIEWYRMISNVGREADRWWVATPTSRKGIVGNISVRHKNVEMILNAHPDSRQAVYKKIYLLTLLSQHGNSF